ncbi:retropepsin-like aspartic protease [Pedobacter cryoconitis]|uniref:Putative aspartyl protease n=1 Tax=Pedobacter cryoconitis TaxID=188932 RepID=A0A7X0J3N1_9SPHI|nr:retropepsin-like aspartic protease [Pedobacter cryoconitis]MBB6500526.1 putative aspartyl protease [Pedobacter cryoconitis]
MRTIAVPLTLINLNDDGFHLLVEIVVYGQKYWAVVDTGASRSVFDKAFIEKHSDDVIVPDDTNATTLFTTSSTIQTIIPRLKIGKLNIKSYQAVALDLETVNEAYVAMGHPRIVAIIGSDIFFQYQAKINYKKLKIQFCAKPA